MLSCLDGGVPGVDGAVERGRSGACAAGVILIRLPSDGWGVDGLGFGSLWDSGACGVGNGDCEGLGLGASEEVAAPSPDGEAGVGFESFARRLLRI